ncbi:MAG TPA: TolC family protein [Bacteroidales bacterium]|nr:TolC family protein [Bacteroidales bacterium]
MKKGLFLCSMILLGFLPVKAQKVWSLEECINYALENNLQIKRQELNVRYNKNNYNQSYFNTLPNLNGQISQGYSSGQTYDYFESQYKDQNYWSGSLGIGSNMTLFGGFQIVNNIMKTRFDYLKSQSDLERSKNDISLTLALAYLDILFSRELLDAAQNKLEVTSLQAERTKKLLEVGNVAQGEYLQIKAQESNDKTNVLNASNNLGIAYLNLTQLLDLDSTGGFEIVIPANIDVEILAPLETVQEIYALAIKQMPQIKSAEYALKSSEKQLMMAWGQASPTLSIGANMGTFHSQVAINPADPEAEYTSRQQLKDYYNKQLNLTLSVPLFNRLQVKNSISNSQLQVRDFKLQLDQAKMVLYKEVQQAHADALAAKEKYSASVEAVNYNQEAFKYTSQKMEVGLVNSVDFNVAQNNLIKATSDMLQAKYEYIFRRKILDLYMGKLITL